MPNIDRFNGIKINVYNNKHPPPHIHATYNEHEALIEIENFKIYAGDLPIKQMRQVLVWLKDNSELTLKIFYRLNPRLK